MIFRFFRKLIEKWGKILGEGPLYFKVRSQLGRTPPISKLLSSSADSVSKLEKNETVAIAGGGVAALKMAEELKAYGHENVVLIYPNNFIGGKCINFGCMPTDIFWAKVFEKSVIKEQIFEEQKKIILELRTHVEQKFKQLNYKYIDGRVTKIEGRTAVVTTAKGEEKVSFDRFVFATGSGQKTPESLGDVLPVEGFWDAVRNSDSSIAIVTDRNLAAVSYGDIAREMGLSVDVIFTERPSMHELPSFRHFVREIEKRGTKIWFGSKSLSRNGNSILFRSQGQLQKVDFSLLFYLATPSSNFPPIDGKKFDALDVDLKNGNLSKRKDIFATGDAAGLMTATEAEIHSRELARSWMTGQLVDIKAMTKIPFCLNSFYSLAWVGSPWTLFRRDWKEIDFKMLGWSHIHGKSGKLWYLFDKWDGRIEAIHICHPDASELIVAGGALMDLPADSLRWMTLSLHPSKNEIFKLVVEDIERNFPALRYRHHAQMDASPITRALTVPEASKVYEDPFFKKEFTENQIRNGVLDSNPTMYFSLLYGLKSILDREVPLDSGRVELKRNEKNRYFCETVPDFNYLVQDGKNALWLEAKGRSRVIALSSSDLPQR